MRLAGAVAVALLVAGPADAGHGIRWERDFDAALQRAKLSGKPVMIDFWAEWCGWCHRLDQTTYVDPVVVKLAEDFVPVKVDTEGGLKQAGIARRYDVSTLPTILFVTPGGRAILRVNGFQGPGQFPRTLEGARQAAERVMGWETAIEKRPRDAGALLALGAHLFEQEFYEESRELFNGALRHDRQSPAGDRKRARMLLAIIQTYDRKYSEAERLLKQALEIRPAGELEPRLLFVLGRTYLAWGRPGDARRTMQQILDDYTASAMAQKARETLAALDRSPR